MQPIALALTAQTQPTTTTTSTSSRVQTPNAAINTPTNNSDILKSANKRDVTTRDTTTPLDLSVRRLSPGSNSRERSLSVSSMVSLEHARLDMDIIMEGKENMSVGSESITPEQIVCAPSLPGSPPLTPSPKRRSHSPRGGSISLSPNSLSSIHQQVMLRPMLPAELALRLAEPSLHSLPSHQILTKHGVELALRLSSVSSNNEISPQQTPPLLNILSNSGNTTPQQNSIKNPVSNLPPQIFVKQGVSKCKECNIVFCKYENYLAHKKHYCSARNLDENDSGKTSPPNSPPPTSPSGGATLAYQQLICAACGIKFTSLDNLSAHQMYYCPKRVEIPVQQQPTKDRCNKCKTVHEPGSACSAATGAYKCPICDVVSSSSAELRKHMETHGGVKAFRCSICRYKGNTLRWVFLVNWFFNKINLIFIFFAVE